MVHEIKTTEVDIVFTLMVMIWAWILVIFMYATFGIDGIILQASMIIIIPISYIVVMMWKSSIQFHDFRFWKYWNGR